MQFLGKDIKNAEMFNEGLIANWTELYHKYSGTSFEAKNGDTLHYYKEPNYLGEEGDIFRLAFIHLADGTLYQLGVVKEPYLLIDSEVFAEAHKNALTTIKAENPPVDGPKDEVPTPDQPTKEVEDPTVEPKPEEPKEDKPVDDKPAEEKPKEEEPKTEAPAEELPEARRDEKVFFEAGRYFVERVEEGSGNISRVTVKPAKNAYDVATGEMILEDAPEGEEILQDDLGRHYYVDKKLDRIVYVKPKKADTPAEEPKEDKPAEDAPKEEEPKEDKPADETPKEETPGEGSVDTPDVPAEEKPKEEHPLLNGEPVTNARTNDVVQSWLAQLEGKGYSHNVAGTIRIYELLKAIANGEITIEVFFHELASGVLTKTEMTKAEASIDFFALRQEVNALIEKYLKEIDTPR